MVTVIKKIVFNEKLQDGIECFAKLLFLLYVMLGFNSIMYGHKIISYVMWPAFLLCAGLLGWRVLRYKRYYKMPALITMILFLLSHCLSSVLNYKYDLKNNVILFIYLVIFFLLFYVYPLRKEPEKVKKEFSVISVFFVFYAFVGSIASIIMLINGESSVSYVGFDNYEVVSGFKWGRLWGIFLEPSRAALMMMVAIILLVYFFIHTKKMFVKLVCVVSVVPMFIYIVFSDSRTTVVSIFCAAFAGMVLYLFTAVKKKVIIILRNALLCVILPLILAASPLVVKEGYNTYAEALETKQHEITTQPVVEETTAPVEETTAPIENTTVPIEETTVLAEEVITKAPVDLPEIERNYDLSGDISNRRFDIWKSGFEMFVVKPVFGYSYNGIRPYAMEKMPETYIINNGAKLFSNFHNEVINVLTAQGVVGFVIFIAMIVLLLVFILKNFRNLEGKDKKTAALLISVIVGLSAGAMFGSLMFYASTAASPMFWLCLGYLVYLLKNSKKKTDTSEMIVDEA